MTEHPQWLQPQCGPGWRLSCSIIRGATEHFTTELFAVGGIGIRAVIADPGER